MAYTDLTASFPYKALLTSTLMTEAATNDSYNLLPSGTKAVFVQAAAPIGWTKDTTNNDAVLRVVDGTGTGGATGGTGSISSPPTHSHVTGAFSDVAGGGGTGAGVLANASGFGAQSVSSVVGFTPKYVNIIVCTHT